MNTWFEKSQKDLITFRTPSRKYFTHQYDFEHFAQMDFVLCNKQWKNTIKDVNAKIGVPFDSDHKALETEISVKLAKKEREKIEKPKRYFKPDDDQYEMYNGILSNKVDQADWQNMEEPIKEWTRLINEAAFETLMEVPPKVKQPYITAKSWKLMEEREIAIKEEKWEEVREINDKIKKSVKEDKTRYKLDQLEEIDKQAYKWDGLKRLKAKFTPNFTNIIDKN